MSAINEGRKCLLQPEERRKMSSSNRLRIATAIAAASIGVVASAQGQVAERAAEAVRRAQPTVMAPLSPGMTAAPKPPEPKRDTPWRTKAELLAAVRNGDFRGLPEVRVNQAAQTAPLTDSVIHILRHEYDVPTLATGKTAGSMDCRSQASEEIRRLLTSITALHIATLSDKPPTFYRDAPTAALAQDIQLSLRSLGNGGGLCSTKVMGVERPHPYGAALRQLADDFGNATKEYVESQRTMLKADYEAQQKAIAEADAKRKADADAAQQDRINAERARIQRQQQQQQQQQSRISG